MNSKITLKHSKKTILLIGPKYNDLNIQQDITTIENIYRNNYGFNKLTGEISKKDILKVFEDILFRDIDILVIYFTGHGYKEPDKDIFTNELSELFKQTRIPEINLIFDCCFSKNYLSINPEDNYVSKITQISATRENDETINYSYSFSDKPRSIFTKSIEKYFNKKVRISKLLKKAAREYSSVHNLINGKIEWEIPIPCVYSNYEVLSSSKIHL